MSREHGLLWIKGNPGTGKSTLMAFVYREFQAVLAHERHVTLDFFFHGRGTNLQKTPMGMFRSLIHQLFTRAHSVRDPIRESFQGKKAFGEPGKGWEWQLKELQDHFFNAVVYVAKTRAITIFVDALDEAGSKAAEELVTYFHTLNDRLIGSNSARICISCRHYPVIASNPSLEIYVENENREDISTFVQGELNSKFLVREKDPTSINACQSLEAAIVKKALGVFQWARLVVPMVVERLDDGESLEDIHQMLARVPEELGAVYEHILKNVIKARYMARALHLMQWICLAEKPLSVTELRFAMASDDACIHPSQLRSRDAKDFVETDARMEKLTRSLSGGLAEVKHYWYDSIVQFVHQSVNDFMLSNGLNFLASAFADTPLSRGSGNSMNSSSDDIIGRSQHRLSRSCINHLKLKEVLRQVEVGRIKTRSQMMKELPFVAYATKSWFLHAEKAESHGISQEGLVQQFESPQQVFGTWIKLYRAIDKESNKCPKKGSTLLHVASGSNLQSTLRVLLQKGTSIEEEDSFGRRALYYAARWGHTAVVEMLLDKGAEANAQGGEYGNAFQAAARWGHKAVVELLLDKGGGPNLQGGEHCDALQAAARWGHKVVVELILDKGGGPNVQGGEYGNALQAAAYYGDGAIVELLLDNGAEVNAQGGKYGNALQAATWRGHKAVVKLLLHKGAKANAQGGEYGNALQAAVSSGDKAIIELLLDKGADANAQGGIHGGALQAAIWNCRKSIVELLLDKGADINMQGEYCTNALWMAARWDRRAILELLLDKGAEVNAQDGYSCALQGAACASDKTTVELLLDKGANINVQGGRFSDSALRTAAAWGHKAVVELLLDRGAEVNAQGGEYGDPLQTAAHSGHKEIVELLLDKGAEVNAQGGVYGDPLQAAARSGHKEIVELLLDKGAEVNAQSGEYGNALQAAAYHGDEPVVELLLDKGAKVNTQGGKYGNALQAAAYRGNEAVFKLLLDKGAEADAQGGEYGNALQAAACCGHKAIVELLLDKGAEVNAQGGQYGNTLQAAARCGHKAIVELLLGKGAKNDAAVS
jgi:ankyrin repeat protein